MAEAALKGIDHTLVGVRDLEAARALWTRMGFTLTPRGRHIGWGTANYCIMFGHTYIELLGIVDPTQFTNNLDKFLATREGLMGLAFASDDVEATKAGLLAAGLHPDGPKKLKRLLELPEGTVVPEFRLLYLPKEETPDLSAFVCCHLTPELVRRDEWMGHPNGALGVRSVTLLSDHPSKSAHAYRRMFGNTSIAETEGRASIRLNLDWNPPPRNSSHFVDELVFVTREALQEEYPEIQDWPRFPAPLPVVMTIDAWDSAITLEFLESAGFAPTSYRKRSWSGCWLSPGEANGLVLHFCDAR
jgi:catechol 2,3-dioxygenase-like lactoylglutathione lyase family enzyme